MPSHIFSPDVPLPLIEASQSMAQELAIYQRLAVPSTPSVQFFRYIFCLDREVYNFESWTRLTDEFSRKCGVTAIPNMPGVPLTAFNRTEAIQRSQCESLILDILQSLHQTHYPKVPVDAITLPCFSKLAIALFAHVFKPRRKPLPTNKLTRLQDRELELWVEPGLLPDDDNRTFDLAKYLSMPIKSLCDFQHTDLSHDIRSLFPDLRAQLELMVFNPASQRLHNFETFILGILGDFVMNDIDIHMVARKHGSDYGLGDILQRMTSIADPLAISDNAPRLSKYQTFKVFRESATLHSPARSESGIISLSPMPGPHPSQQSSSNIANINSLSTVAGPQQPSRGNIVDVAPVDRLPRHIFVEETSSDSDSETIVDPRRRKRRRHIQSKAHIRKSSSPKRSSFGLPRQHVDHASDENHSDDDDAPLSEHEAPHFNARTASGKEIEDILRADAENNHDVPILEHFSVGIYQQAMELFHVDWENSRPDESVRLHGVVDRGEETKWTRRYQLIAVFWMLKQLMDGQAFGGIIGDAMGLGKTHEILIFIWTLELQQSYIIEYRTEHAAPVVPSLRSSKALKHLPKDCDPNDLTLECPSQKPGSPDCCCQPNSPTKKWMQFILNAPILVLLRPCLMRQFQHEFAELFGQSTKSTVLAGQRQMTLSINHRDFAKFQWGQTPITRNARLGPGSGVPSDNYCRHIIVAAPHHAISTWVENYAPLQAVGWVHWSAIIWDEFHLVKSQNAKAPVCIRRMMHQCRKLNRAKGSRQRTALFGFSGTPIRSSIQDTLVILSILEVCAEFRWDKDQMLRVCSSAEIIDLAKDVIKLDTRMEAAQAEGGVIPSGLLEEQRLLSIRQTTALTPVMISRRASCLFFGKPLMELPRLLIHNGPHTEFETPYDLLNSLQKLSNSAKEMFEQDYRDRIDAWRRRMRRGAPAGPEPLRRITLNTMNNIAYRRLLFAADFPQFARICELEACRAHDYEAEPLGSDISELPLNRQYIAKYKLSAEGSSANWTGTWMNKYWHLLVQSPKLQLLKTIITVMLATDGNAQSKKLGLEKALVCCAMPIGSVIVRRFLKESFPDVDILYLHSNISMQKRGDQIAEFNLERIADEDDSLAADNSGFATARIIISTYPLLATGYNIQAANHLLLFGQPFEGYNLSQAISRIYRSGQMRQCNVYPLRNLSSPLETKFHLRSSRQEMMFDMIFSEPRPVRPIIDEEDYVMDDQV